MLNDCILGDELELKLNKGGKATKARVFVHHRRKPENPPPQEQQAVPQTEEEAEAVAVADSLRTIALKNLLEEVKSAKAEQHQAAVQLSAFLSRPGCTLLPQKPPEQEVEAALQALCAHADCTEALSHTKKFEQTQRRFATMAELGDALEAAVMTGRSVGGGWVDVSCVIFVSFLLTRRPHLDRCSHVSEHEREAVVSYLSGPDCHLFSHMGPDRASMNVSGADLDRLIVGGR